MGVDRELQRELNALHSSRDELISELSELGELWLEWRASGRNTHQPEVAIAQATQELRRIEKKIHKLTKRLGGLG